ncbi:MAG: hypothetical protein OEY14_02265 [Myxococcales bacterium]|nr:hypothetical protein [Myxococcales bacterium]
MGMLSRLGLLGGILLLGCGSAQGGARSGGDRVCEPLPDPPSREALLEQVADLAPVLRHVAGRWAELDGAPPLELVVVAEINPCVGGAEDPDDPAQCSRLIARVLRPGPDGALELVDEPPEDEDWYPSLIHGRLDSLAVEPLFGPCHHALLVSLERLERGLETQGVQVLVWQADRLVGPLFCPTRTRAVSGPAYEAQGLVSVRGDVSPRHLEARLRVERSRRPEGLGEGAWQGSYRWLEGRWALEGDPVCGEPAATP